MATASLELENKSDRWKRAVVGSLSNDFLRITTSKEIQEQADRQAAIALYQQQQMVQTPFMSPNIVGRLSITVAQAKLVKNYGMTRMDPYVRLRLGHYIYETPTDPNGGKNPRWNRVIHCQLPVGVHSIYLEIYDECNFKIDELIAWTEIKIPEGVMRGETHEAWYPLSGKQGDGVEGMIDLVFSFSTAAAPTYLYQPVHSTVILPNNRPLPVFVAPPQTQTIASDDHIIQTQIQQPIKISDDDLKQFSEMFPSLDQEVIKSVFVANNGNKNSTINSLLQMTST